VCPPLGILTDLSEENQKKVLARIVKLGDSKQTITTDDLPFIIADVLESKNYQHIKLLNCACPRNFRLCYWYVPDDFH
jgi:D-citramalate synthase